MSEANTDSTVMLSPAKDQIDSTNVICPYCEHVCYQPEGENYSEDEVVDECDECGKKFYSCQSFTVDHESRGDCKINDEEHDYQPGTSGLALFCSKCGAIQPYDERDNGGGEQC